MAVIAARRIHGAVAAFAAAAVLASAAAADGWVADADRALFEQVRARRGKTGTVIARRISALAEPAVVYPVLAVVGARAGWRRGWEPCPMVASGAVLRRCLSQVIARPRPPRQRG
jgi:hypothetical protein